MSATVLGAAAEAEAFLAHPAWRAVLAAGTAFAGLAPGACIGVVPRDVARCEHGPMLQWRAGAGGLTSRRAVFTGFAASEADVIFVVDDAALAALDDLAGPAVLAELRRQVRRGGVVLYFLKCEGKLLALGYEGFLETLGLTIMGACR